MAAVAGYNADLYITGTSTAMTDEACTEVSGTVFQITNTAKRILDHDVAIVVKANAVVQSGNYTIEANFGIVTFTDGSHTGETITVTANYLPRHNVAQIRSETLTITWVTGDTTAQQDPAQRVILTQKQVSFSVDAVQLLDVTFDGGTTELDDVISAGNAVVLEFQHLGASSNVYRARGVGDSMSISNNGPAGVAGSTLNFVSAARGVTLVSTASI
jgi:hypothetical protein